MLFRKSKTRQDRRNRRKTPPIRLTTPTSGYSSDIDEDNQEVTNGNAGPEIQDNASKENETYTHRDTDSDTDNDTDSEGNNNDKESDPDNDTSSDVDTDSDTEPPHHKIVVHVQKKLS